jgi:hypothetical protein
MKFKGKSKEEILQWYVENVPVGSIIEYDANEGVTHGIPYLSSHDDVVVDFSSAIGGCAIMWHLDENREGYKLMDPKVGFNINKHTSAEEDKARETELKEKAFEIYKGYVVATVMYSDDELVIKSYEAAEAFLNYKHQ